MVNLKQLIESAGPDRLDATITIEGNPVWDYKMGDTHTVFLISEDPWEGVEEEFVTLRELRKYIIDSFIPFDLVKFKTEADKEIIKSFKWEEDQLSLSHY